MGKCTSAALSLRGRRKAQPTHPMMEPSWQLLHDRACRAARAAGGDGADWLFARQGAGGILLLDPTGALAGICPPFPWLAQALAGRPACAQVAGWAPARERGWRALLALPLGMGALLIGGRQFSAPAALAAAGELAAVGAGGSRLEWMAAAVAHEVRNPLSAIKAAVQYLQGKLQDDQSLHFLGLINQETDRLTRLTTNFLTYARPCPVPVVAVSLPRLLRHTWEVVAPQAHKAGVSATFHLPARLPPVWGEGELLEQVLLNVMLNALQAMPGGGEITVRARAGRGQVLVTIADQGEGIPPEHLVQVFEPFFTTRAQGSGLGLALVRKIMQEHGGWVRLASRVGKGTLVTLGLPATQPQAAG